LKPKKNYIIICDKSKNSKNTFSKNTFSKNTTEKNKIVTKSDKIISVAKKNVLKKNILKNLKKIRLFDNEILEAGTIVSIKDGVAQVKGLQSVKSGEMVFLGFLKIKGMVLSLEQRSVSVVIFGNDTLLKQDDKVFRTFSIMSIPLHFKLFGRVIDALGNTIDGGSKIKTSLYKPVDTKAVGIIPRESINEPMQTGIKAIDSITPIGCGQRELIIGDRQTGKTTIAIDTILSQKKYGKMFCIYVAIGQKKSTVAQIYESLKKRSAILNTIIVSATSSESATLQFLAPYSGCCIGE